MLDCLLLSNVLTIGHNNKTEELPYLKVKVIPQFFYFFISSMRMRVPLIFSPATALSVATAFCALMAA